jgi:predicted exporter
MLDRGIVRQTPAGTYWLDVVAYDDDLQARYRRIKVALFVVIALLLIGLALGMLRT